MKKSQFFYQAFSEALSGNNLPFRSIFIIG